MKKVVLKLEFADEKIKQKAMKKVSGLSGVESIAMDLKDKKLTVMGDIDPVSVVDKIKKLCETKIVSVGLAKEPEKDQKQPEVVPSNVDDGNQVEMPEYLNPYEEFHRNYYYYYRSVEENPKSCVIC